MAAVNPPWACQGRTDHPASLYRMALSGVTGAPFAAGLTSSLGGVDPYTGQALAITGLASLNVQVGTGLVYIPSTSAWGGMYAGYNNATFNVALAAASSTQWRRDLIVAQMSDPGDATANWNVVAVTGTFSSSSPGALPTQPANSVLLAIIVVVPNMTVTTGGGTVVDARVFNGLKGVWPTTSSVRPSLSCPEGTMWFETDTNLLGIIVNGAYQYVPIGVADTWHTLGALGNGWTTGHGRYRLHFDGELEIDIALTGTGSAGNFNFPTATAAGSRPVMTRRLPATQGTGGVGWTTISTSGVVSVAIQSNGTGTYDCCGRVPLD